MIWFQTVWHFDVMSERKFWKKNQQAAKQACKIVAWDLCLQWTMWWINSGVIISFLTERLFAKGCAIHGYRYINLYLCLYWIIEWINSGVVILSWLNLWGSKPGLYMALFIRDRSCNSWKFAYVLVSELRELVQSWPWQRSNTINVWVPWQQERKGNNQKKVTQIL